MGIEGALSLQGVSLKEAVVSMADFFDFYNLDISGETHGTTEQYSKQ